MPQELHEESSSEWQVSCRKGWEEILGLHGERVRSVVLLLLFSGQIAPDSLGPHGL